MRRHRLAGHPPAVLPALIPVPKRGHPRAQARQRGALEAEAEAGGSAVHHRVAPADHQAQKEGGGSRGERRRRGGARGRGRRLRGGRRRAALPRREEEEARSQGSGSPEGPQQGQRAELTRQEGALHQMAGDQGWSDGDVAGW